MSKERARTREARQAARAAEKAKAARARARRKKVASLRPPVPRRGPARPARYGAMPLKHKLALAFGLLAVQFVGWQLLPGAAQRLGLFLLSLLALPLVVTLYFSPRSSR